jgi:hypothetical protein
MEGRACKPRANRGKMLRIAIFLGKIVFSKLRALRESVEDIGKPSAALPKN